MPLKPFFSALFRKIFAPAFALVAILTALLSAAPALAKISWPDPLNENALQTAAGGGLRYAISLVSVAAVAMYVYAGFLWMIASGDPERLGKARAILIWTTLGTATVIFGYALVYFLTTTLQSVV